VEVALRSLAGISFGLVVTVLFAAISYRFLEKPFLKLKERFTFVTSRAA
jgi:peptidoglycan/LPS O-acetylase OafA/YrhL